MLCDNVHKNYGIFVSIGNVKTHICVSVFEYRVIFFKKKSNESINKQLGSKLITASI